MLAKFPQEVTFNILKYLSEEDIEVVMHINYYWYNLINENKSYINHLKLQTLVKPSLSHNLQLSNNYELSRAMEDSSNKFLLDYDTRIELLKTNIFLQKLVKTRLPTIYVESVHNKFFSGQLNLLGYLKLRNIKMKLTLELGRRPTKRQLQQQGILHYRDISIHINTLKRTIIDDFLKSFLNTYRYTRLSGEKLQRQGTVDTLVQKFSASLTEDCADLKVKSVTKSEADVLRSVKIENRKLFFEKMAQST